MPQSQPERDANVSIVGVGASAGGIQALQNFFAALPEGLGHAYVVILHLSPDHKSNLCEILARMTKMPVTEVGDDDAVPVEANHVYVISPDRKLELSNSSIGAAPFDQPRGRRTAVDVFLRSLAEAHGDGFAVILSGGGSDGVLGAKAVKEAGGLVLVQDPYDAEHVGMPESVIAAGLADIVAPASELGTRLADLTRNRNRVAELIQPHTGRRKLKGDDEATLQQILERLRLQTGHDFSQYKRNTVLRRLARRMQLNHTTTFADYLQLLRQNAEEIHALLDDLLITVTTFFRDPDAWTALCTKAIGPIVEAANQNEPIRAWVPACATGEEAYSLAIAFHEEMERRSLRRELVIFASDLDEGALTTARDGRYLSAIGNDVSEERLDRFFRKHENHYRVSGEIRDCIVFARHSVLRDPPFSGLHLVSCRNLLIYLERGLQEQMQSIFRYACRDDGYLFLGVSESANRDYFKAVDKRNRIFRARPNAPGTRQPLPGFVTTRPHRGLPETVAPRTPSAHDSLDLHLALLEKYSPPSMLVDSDWNVLHLSDSAGRYLQQRAGEIKSNVAEILRQELREEARALLERAFATGERTVSGVVPVQFNGTPRRVFMIIHPRPPVDGESPTAVLIFIEAGRIQPDEFTTGSTAPSDEVVTALRDKLRRAELRIDRMNVDHDVTNQDLRATNEELQSLNEEYRSTAEELETSKEELQSVNEELQTVNNELKNKLEEMARAHNDLENLMAATDIATLFLDRALAIKRFTPRLAEIFNVKTRDEGRPIGDFTHNLEYGGLIDDARAVLRNLVPIERAARLNDGRFLMVRLRPYRTADDRIEGVVVTFVDVSPLKQTEEALRDSEAQLESELHVTQRLHRMSMTVATAESQQEALDEIVAAAIDLHDADSGNIQIYDRAKGYLRIVAHQGFAPSAVRQLDTVVAGEGSASDRAFRSRKAVRIADVMSDEAYVPYRKFATELGYRAVQSTPLLGEDNSVIGILSTHFREPYRTSERDEQVAELLARQAAALILKRNQQERLQELNDELHRRTTELEASEHKLREQARELLQQDRAKEDFLSLLGHELRNPLAAIRNSLDLIEVSRSMPAAERGEEFTDRALTVVSRQSRHMTRLVNDLLDINRINQGKLRLQREPLNVRACIDDVINALGPQCEAAKVTVAVEVPDEPVWIEADPERIVQILDNLVRNAVNFTDPGGRITVSAAREGREGRISVRDTGIGIDPGKIAALFEPYQQADDGGRGGGLGLGLTLAKRLVELHGGTISAHSDGPGHGSEFVIRVRLAAGRPTATPSATPKVDKLRILVVDDDADNADSFGALLASLGHETTIVYDGRAALETVHRLEPRVAFVDLTMPGMSGHETARLIREAYGPDRVTLVALSGHPQTADGAAFDHHLLKPASMESVAEVLASVGGQTAADAR